MAVFLYAFTLLAEGEKAEYANHCCYDETKPWEDYKDNESQFHNCCCTLMGNQCSSAKHRLKTGQYITVYDLPANTVCHKGKCRAGKDDSCSGSAPQCSAIHHDNAGSTAGRVDLWVTRVVSVRAAKALRELTSRSEPLTLKAGNGRTYGVDRYESEVLSVLRGVSVEADGDSSLNGHYGLRALFGLTSGGNATATAEEADEVMDKFLADAEMELSNPVLITGVGAVFVILLAAIYCFCCKKKRGANDSRSESHGRQHSNKRNATRYTKPRKESRKAHE